MWRRERKIQRNYLAELKEAKEKGDRKRISELNDRYEWALWELSDDRHFLMQQEAIRKAQRLGLHIPWREEQAILAHAEDENWRMGTNCEWLLREKALTDLRREIRREQKEKRDLFIPWVSLLIGLFGSVASVLGTLLAWWAWSSK